MSDEGGGARPPAAEAMTRTARRPSSRVAVGAVLYGVLWVVALPALLVWWARGTAAVVPLPVLHSLPAGMALVGIGLALILGGMAALRAVGGGLPMNAYPPPRYVAVGVYRWLAHPIYVGFVLLAAGVAIGSGSASGLWLVTPVAALALAALVWGYERHDLRRRFGATLRSPRLALPRAADGDADGWERLAVYLLVLLPWLLAYEAVHLLGVPPDAIDSRLAFERAWPVLEWSEAIYATPYLTVVATPWLVRSRRALRHFALCGLVATATVTLIYLVLPLVSPPRPFEPTTVLGRLLAVERELSHTVGAFPAFHVLWPLFVAVAWRSRGRGWGAVGFGWALLIAVSCVTTGMHSLADVAFAFVLFPLLDGHRRVWETLRRLAERVANSWREWRFGPLRVIDHGSYAAVAGGLGSWLIGWLAGPRMVGPVVVVAIASLVGAALWGQALEGSSRLLRPLGFYGGLLGGLVGIAGLALAGVPVFPLLGAGAVALPWVQALGRLRCLVQGCCHGGPAPNSIGIRYRHPRSRVVQLAELADQPLHPTPLYSLLANVVIGLLLARLWSLAAAPGLVAGLYLVLSGLARFVEEAYRAEPQTPVVARLRIYQWLAVAGLLAGITLTTLGPPVAPSAGDRLALRLVAAAVGVGLLAGFIAGVDFPRSSRRFSRLAATDR